MESYERIELSGVPETEIHGQAVTDLVHLLAELLENATTFSSPQTKVRVTATRLPDSRVMVEIHDKGIGLTAEDFADINHKLANPPTVDAAVSQRMGLFVVGRLADRHGIRVQLRPSGEQAGTTSLVMLPDAITHGGGGELEPIAAQDDFTVSSIIPRQQAFEPLPHQPQMRTAAELGFDDSRYEDPAVDPAQLDPVGRSLMREERRAALEAQTGGERPQFQEDAFQGNAYQEASYAEDTYAQDPQQEQYPQAAYDSSYNTYSGDSGYAEQSDYPSQGGYTEAAYAAAESAQRGYEDQFAAQPHQEEWADQGAYQGAYEPISQAEPESVPSAPAEPQERVGFDRSGPTPNVGREMTDAGLPRRGGQQHWQPTGRGNDQSVAAQQQQPQQQELPQQPSPAPQDGNGSDDWRSTNDERWERAEKLREPKAGGVTPSGLPRRVPKANLVEGTAEQTQQGGPQVSRAPEDVRGRLSNLRRGIQRGRNAGSDTSNTYNQER